MTTLTIRTDENIKKLLQARAKQLGLSLNQFINLGFRYLISTDKLVINLEEDLTWNEDLQKEYEKVIEELEKGEAVIFDPKSIKSEDDFIKFIKNINV